MKFIKLASVLLLGTLVSCSALQTVALDAIGTKEIRNKRNMVALKPGQTKEEVIEILGRPDKTELYPSNDRKVTEIYFYKTEKESMMSDLHGAGVCYTPVVFENEVLIGWGNRHYDDLYANRRK